MNAEWQRQQAEESREQAEDQRQHTEKQRNADEHGRQMAEKQREVGEHLREVERTGDRLVAEYSTRALLARLEDFEERLSRLESQMLRGVEKILASLAEFAHQPMTDQQVRLTQRMTATAEQMFKDAQKI
jgi:hypothetical protein